MMHQPLSRLLSRPHRNEEKRDVCMCLWLLPTFSRSLFSHWPRWKPLIAYETKASRSVQIKCVHHRTQHRPIPRRPKRRTPRSREMLTLCRARVAIAALLAADLVSAALYTDVKQLPTDTFDFVIVGGT